MNSMPKDVRLWPPNAHIEEALRSIASSRCRLVDVYPLGERSLLLDSVTPSGPERFVAYRQRSANIRHNLPLSEEACLLTYLVEHLPERSIKPLYFCTSFSDAQRPFLLVEWKEGVLLGENVHPQWNPRRVQSVLKQELDRLHRVGRKFPLPKLSRVVSLDGLLQRAQEWDPTLWAIGTKKWSVALTWLEQAIQDVGSCTLLHGDAHAYNLLRSGGKYHWLDYEYAAIGPPEMDRARLDVLLAMQAERDLDLDPDQAPLQLACTVFMAGEFLQLPPPFASPKTIYAVQSMLKRAVDRLRYPS